MPAPLPGTTKPHRSSVTRHAPAPPPFRPPRAGTALVELALVVPVLLFLFVVTVDFARIFYFSVTITNSAENGALYGCGNPTRANDKDGIKAAALRDLKNLDATKVTVTSATDSGTNPTYVEVTVSYPFETITGLIGLPQTLTVTRKTRMNVSPWTPG